MKTTVRGPLTHLCPHVDEVDVGEVEITFDGPAPELHDLGRLLLSYAARQITHEALTAELYAELSAEHCVSTFCERVVTRWMTAGLAVEVTAP